MSAGGLVSRALPVHTAMRNCTRDEGRPFEFGNQVLISSHRKLLSSKAMVVNVAETSGRDPGRHGCVPNHGKLWKSLMRAHLGDYEALEARLTRRAGDDYI